MSEKRRPLTPAQTLAAERVGLGWLIKDIAEQTGCSTKAIQRWQHRDDFRALVEQSRRRVLEANPTPTAVLTAALNAVRKDGSPAWDIRCSAAKALLGATPLGDTPEERVRETRIYIGQEPKP